MKIVLKAGIDKKATEDFNRKYELYQEIQAELGFKSIWSIFELNSREDFNKVAFKGVFDVFYKYYSSREKVEPVSVNNPTWMDLWRAADQLITQSGDSSHIYIEKFAPRTGATLELITGS